MSYLLLKMHINNKCPRAVYIILIFYLWNWTFHVQTWSILWSLVVSRDDVCHAILSHENALHTGKNTNSAAKCHLSRATTMTLKLIEFVLYHHTANEKQQNIIIVIVSFRQVYMATRLRTVRWSSSQDFIVSRYYFIRKYLHSLAGV